MKDLEKLNLTEERKTEENEAIEQEVPEHFVYSSSSSSSSESERYERQPTVKRKDRLMGILSHNEEWFINKEYLNFFP